MAGYEHIQCAECEDEGGWDCETCELSDDDYCDDENCDCGWVTCPSCGGMVMAQ